MYKIVEKCTDNKEHAQRVWNGRSSAYCSKTYKEVLEHFRTSCFDWHDDKVGICKLYTNLFYNNLRNEESSIRG